MPEAVSVTLTATSDGAFTTQPAIARKTLDPDRAGAFVANLSFTDLPPGEYQVTTRVGKAEIASRTLLVGPIAKPAWKLALEVPKRAVLTGDSVTVNAEAAFFEGTPVAGSDLRFSAENEDDAEGNAGSPDQSRPRTPAGRATARVPVRLGGDDSEESQWSVQSVHVRPNDPEEGDIYADAPVVVFRSTAVLDVKPVLKGTTLTITGAVHEVDFDRYDEDPAAELCGDRPAGRPARGPAGRHQDQREHPGHPPDGHQVRLHRQAHRPRLRVVDPDEGAAGTGRHDRRGRHLPAGRGRQGRRPLVRGEGHARGRRRPDGHGSGVGVESASRATTRARAWSGPAATRAGAPTASVTP